MVENKNTSITNINFKNEKIIDNSKDKNLGTAPNDSGLAQRLIDEHGADFRYVKDWKIWVVWNGSHWEIDHDAILMTRLCNLLSQKMLEEAAKTPDDDKRTKMMRQACSVGNIATMANIIKTARIAPGISIKSDVLDKEHFLLNVINSNFAP